MKKKAIFLIVTLLAVVESCMMILMGVKPEYEVALEGSIYVLMFSLMSFFFGIYAFFIMKSRLPEKYDKEHLDVFVDEDFMNFSLNVGGLRFHNGNWPHIVKALQTWCIITLLVPPIMGMGVLALKITLWGVLGVLMVMLLAYLISLFVPIYMVGKKYE